jgi:hypothetical protein
VLDDSVLEPTTETVQVEGEAETPDAAVNDDEVVVEEVVDDPSKSDKTASPPKMKTIIVDEWLHLNSQPPLWMRSVVISHTHSSCLTFFCQGFQGSYS